MDRTSRPIVAALGALLLAGGLSACGGEAAGQSGEAYTQVSFVEDGFLTMCTDAPYEPFEFKRGGEYVGFDVDLVREIAKGFDAKLKIVDSAFDDISDGTVLNEEECDVAVSAMTITGSRARVVDFSSPYFDASQVMVTEQGSGISTVETLANVRVGVQADTTGETYLRDFAPDTTKIVAYDDLADLEEALVTDAVSAIVLDNTIAGPVVSQNDDLRVAAEFNTGEQYGMAVRKDANVPLLRVINDELTELRESGKYDEIYNRYF
jgi:polar amino acid transport system substrate-binding protein